MIHWQDKLAWLGMLWKTVSGDSLVNVQVLRNPGRVSFGSGNTLELALEEAAWGQNINWCSVERKMTDVVWSSIAHC